MIPRKINYTLSHTLTAGEILNLAKTASQSKQIENLSNSSIKNKSGYYSDALIDNLMGWKANTPIGKGLRNMGNTCFLNSVLQCILYTPALKNYVLTYKHQDMCKINGLCFLCEYSKLVKNCATTNGGSETPINYIQNLKHISKHLRVGRQEDAHEFLIYLLDAMERSSKQFMELNSNRFIFDNSNLNSDNLIQKVYGGVTKSSVICGKCKIPSDTFEQFLDADLVTSI